MYAALRGWKLGMVDGKDRHEVEERRNSFAWHALHWNSHLQHKNVEASLPPWFKNAVIIENTDQQRQSHLLESTVKSTPSASKKKKRHSGGKPLATLCPI